MNIPNDKDYVRLTLAILKDFQIKITPKLKKEFLELTTREEVNRYKTKLIKEKLDSI